MPKSSRRRAAGSRSSLILLAVIVVAAGVGFGALLPGCRPSREAERTPRPSAAPAPVAPPASRPASPAPHLITVDQAAVDTAVRTALSRLGQSRVVSEESVTQRREDGELQYVRRRLDVTSNVGLKEAVEIIRKEVERAGGKLLSRSATTVRVGVIQGGVNLETHEIRLLPARSPRARVAIIFDDAGGRLSDLDAIIALQRPVVVAVLPGLRYSREVAARARAAGLEVFLHLPLEPEDASKELGPGGITSAMTDEEIAAAVREDLLGVPGAVGINNHMGSKGTADERVMRAVLEVVRQRRLMFVDSMTSGRSIAARLAAEMGIPTGARAVFLDNDDEPGAIRAQLRRLIAMAQERGELIAIGHAQRMTARVLAGMLDEFDRQGVELVPIATLVH